MDHLRRKMASQIVVKRLKKRLVQFGGVPLGSFFGVKIAPRRLLVAPIAFKNGSENQQKSLKFFKDQRKSLKIYENRRKSSKINKHLSYKNLGKCLKMNENLLKFTKINKNQQTSPKLCEDLWKSLKMHGNQ